MQELPKIYRLYLVVFLAVITSCERGPVPESDWMPEVVSMTSEPGTTDAKLIAHLKNVPYGVCECGFYYRVAGAVSYNRVAAVRDALTLTATLSGLLPLTEYEFMVYISNGKGELSSEVSRFCTEESYEFVSVGARPDDVSAILTGTLKDIPAAVKGIGFYYGLSEESMKPCPAEIHDNVISLEIVSLSPQTQYFFKAYVLTDKGYVYSVTSTFATTARNVSFNAEIAQVSAIPGERMAEMEAYVSDQGKEVTECGFYYGTDPTRLRKALSAVSDGSFYLNVSGLAPGTRYYYQAFIGNGQTEKRSELMCFDVFREYKFVRVSARQDGEGYFLEAELEEYPVGASSYGFIYGISPLDSQTCPAEVSGNLIKAYVSGLMYDTEYVFRAFVQAGDRRTLSQWNLFITDKAPSGDVVDPQPDPEPDTDPEPDFPVVPDPDPENIVFADRFVKEMCVAWFDTDADGELSYAEAAAVTRIPAIHTYNSYHQLITSFDELRYFTSLQTADLYGCPRLKSVVLPESVKEVGGGGVVLAACTSLTDVTLPAGLEQLTYQGLTYCHALERIALPTGLKLIGDFAFDECKNLKEIEVPYTVEQISESAFSRCVSLEKFSGRYASTDGKFLIVSGTVVALAPCGISRLEIPDGTVGLGSYLCDSCNELTTVVLPQSVEYVGYNAFIACYGLERFEGKFASEDGRCLIVGGVAKAFAPSGLTSYRIDCHAVDCAFSGCATIRELHFGPSVCRMHEHALLNCHSLTDIYMSSPTPPAIYDDVTLKMNPAVTVHVPASSLETYKTDPGWTAYAGRMIGY